MANAQKTIKSTAPAHLSADSAALWDALVHLIRPGAGLISETAGRAILQSALEARDTATNARTKGAIDAEAQAHAAFLRGMELLGMGVHTARPGRAL